MAILPYRYVYFGLLGLLCLMVLISDWTGVLRTISIRNWTFLNKIVSKNASLCPLKSSDFFEGENLTSVTRQFYRHATHERNSSFPFISGDTFRALADHVFDETTDSSKWNDRMWEIGRGDIVFVCTETQVMRSFFLNATFNRIAHPFVLITHNGDESVPKVEHRWVLDDSRVLAWFTQNIDAHHKKLFPIPIGLANTRWPHGKVGVFQKAFRTSRKPFSQRTTLLYVNFRVPTNPGVRLNAFNWAQKFPNVTLAKDSSHSVYLEELGNSKFVLLPRGNGLDCHRTWEAILMGAVPIVKRSQLDPLFINATVLVVNDWTDVNFDYLQSLDLNPTFPTPVFARYWYDRLLQSANLA